MKDKDKFFWFMHPKGNGILMHMYTHDGYVYSRESYSEDGKRHPEVADDESAKVCIHKSAITGLATVDQIFHCLTAYAIKSGYVGKSILSLEYHDKGVASEPISDQFIYNEQRNILSAWPMKHKRWAYAIYIDGRWAKIIPKIPNNEKYLMTTPKFEQLIEHTDEAIALKERIEDQGYLDWLKEQGYQRIEGGIYLRSIDGHPETAQRLLKKFMNFKNKPS